MADGHGPARGFERLAREREYREESGEESLARVVEGARVLGPGNGDHAFSGPNRERHGFARAAQGARHR